MHAGETGDISHLIAPFLVTNQITHGIQLQKSPVLGYLYYLAQVGITMPLLNESLRHTRLKDSPFLKFFRRGMRVTLCTENPLHVHYTSEPLMEEYATCAQMWRLSVADLCEIARNSVVLSGFPEADKKRWLGDDYAKEGIAGHDVRRTNVPRCRMQFRMDTLQDEKRFLESGSVQKKGPSRKH